MRNKKTADILSRLQSGYALPALSPVAIKLVELATEDRCSVKDLTNLVENANKALYRISEKMIEIERQAGSDSLPSFDSIEVRQGAALRTLQAVAHEIRNPLLVISGFARKLASSLEPDSKGGKYVRIILEEATKLEKALSEMTRVGGAK